MLNPDNIARARTADILAVAVIKAGSGGMTTVAEAARALCRARVGSR